MEGKNHDNTSNLPPAKDSGAVPELKLIQLHKSKEPIISKEKENTGIETICFWNNYTIITQKGDPNIAIFDEEANPYPGFVRPLSDKKITIEWNPNIRYKIKKYNICEDKIESENMRKVSELPPELRDVARDKLEERRKNGWYSGYEETSQMGTSTFIPSKAIMLEDYVVFYSEGNSMFAFKTKNENGMVLAPKDWQRINPKDTFPDDLSHHAEKIVRSYRNHLPLNEKYSVITTDVGINIVDNNDDKEIPLFSQNIPSVENNIFTDPNNPNLVYFCQSNNPKDIKQIDLSEDSGKWRIVSAPLPEEYDNIYGLQLDPSGNFFSFYSKDDFVILARDTLKEVKRVPGLSNVNFDSSGRIRAIDEDGYLIILEPNFGDLIEEINKNRAISIAQDVNIADVFKKEAAKKEEEIGVDLKHLEPLREKYEGEIAQVLTEINSSEEILQIRQSLNLFESTLRQKGLSEKEVNYIMSGLDNQITVKEKVFATKDTQETITLLQERLDSGLSMNSISESRALINAAKASESLLDKDTRQRLRELSQEFDEKSIEFFRLKGGEVSKDIDGLVARIQLDLESFSSKSQMDDWLEFQFPKLKLKLASLANDIPLEAEEAYKKVLYARDQLQGIANKHSEKFKTEYAKVREKAADRTEGIVDILTQEVDGLVQRLREKGFSDRKEAERYLSSSEALKALKSEISGLAGNNPEVAKELLKGLKVKISTTLTEIERGSLTQVAETGQQMVLFGETLFPKWEAKVKQKSEFKVDLVFEEDAKSHGPGVGPGDFFGDISLSIMGSSGKVEKIRLYEGWTDESEWRLGLLNYIGQPIPPSYVSANKFREIKKDYSDWSLGENSNLRKEFQRKREELREFYSKRQKIGERSAEVDDQWKLEAREKIEEYGSFVAEHHIPILRRIDQVKSQPEVEYSNGKGYVPSWQNHWVVDSQTEKDLEKMAGALKMQLDLHEGLLFLKGHAGTGKDVRIKMFCAMTNRPYFGIDGTKWTTEFELSEDVMLESKDGASQTIKVPSAVLNGITTPGAVVYFNEFNAMPEQAQIFLHALMDEKRSLTLKTSSGKSVSADPSVLLVGSMNPNYPGTFDIQFATRSRTVSIEVGYPPLTRNAEENDPNKNPLYDSSEALRMARGIDSLDDLTYEANLEHNDFVRMWDHYVNGLDNGSPEPTVTQKFDIDTSLAIIQFADKLRGDFIKIFEKSRDARNALPVSQPITGRELRRMAYSLNKMTPEQKMSADPETVARNFLEEFYLTHIDKEEDRDKIRNAMKTWTSKKRVMV